MLQRRNETHPRIEGNAARKENMKDFKIRSANGGGGGDFMGGTIYSESGCNNYHFLKGMGLFMK